MNMCKIEVMMQLVFSEKEENDFGEGGELENKLLANCS